jgi:hypothetical protein
MIKDVHTGHCCVFHGCKYSDDDCTVTTNKARQQYPCELCNPECQTIIDELWDKQISLGHWKVIKCDNIETTCRFIERNLHNEGLRNDLEFMRKVAIKAIEQIGW